MRYPHIASRVFDTPLLIEPGRLKTLLAVLGPRFEIDVPQADLTVPERADLATHLQGSGRTVLRTESGVTLVDSTAVIEVFGKLVHRGSSIDAASGLVGYNHISRHLQAALGEPRAEQIVMIFDSPGGEVGGVFDLAEEIYQARSAKPITAVISDVGLSAAYLLASAADEVVATRTGLTGSIGVLVTHLDLSRKAEEEGVTVTHIFAGERKTDGSPFIPLPDEVRERIQARVDAIYAMFVETVARNRGLEDSAVIDTQAAVFMGVEGVEAGLVDRVGTVGDELERLAPPTVPAPVVSAPRVTADGLRAKHVAVARAFERDGAMRERARIRAILEHAKANGHAAIARVLAFETHLTPEAAARLLETVPTHQEQD